MIREKKSSKKTFIIVFIILLVFIPFTEIIISFNSSDDLKLDFKTVNEKNIEYRELISPYSPLTPRVKNLDYNQPLSKFVTPLLGSNEIGLLVKDTVSNNGYISSYFESQFIGDKDLSEIQVGGTTSVQSINAEDMGSGDFDGNLYEDLIVVSSDGTLKVQFYENWAGKGFLPSAATTVQPCESIPTVAIGNFDEDNNDEYAVLGTSSGIPRIWLYEDIVNSMERELIFYGDRIVFKTSESRSNFLYSPSSFDPYVYTDIYGTNVPEDQAYAEDRIEFTIKKYDDVNYTGPIQYGDVVSLIDYTGKAWTRDFLGSDINDIVSGSLGQIIGNPPSLTPNQKFTIMSNKINGKAGLVYYHDFVSFQFNEDYIGGSSRYLAWESNDLHLIINNTDTFNWFKVLREGFHPKTYEISNLAVSHTITPSNYGKIDVVDRDSSEDIGNFLSTKSITTGDIDNDSIDEIVVVGMDSNGWARAWVFDDSTNDYQSLLNISWVDKFQNIYPNVVVGNVDDDTYSEIIFSFSSSATGLISIYDDGLHDFDLMEKITCSNDELCGDFSKLSTGDIDSDGMDEIIFVNGNSDILIWDDNDNDFDFLTEWNAGNDIVPYWDRTPTIPSVNNFIPVDILCSDIDIDGQKEILYSSVNTYSYNYHEGGVGVFSVWDYNETANIYLTGLGPVGTLYDSGSGNRDHPGIINLASEDFNGNHFTVKFLERDTYRAENIIAVIAAPPTQAGISQNYDNTGTTYGVGESSSTGTFAGFSAGAGVYQSFEAAGKVPFISFEIGVEAEATLMFEFSMTETTTNEITYSSSFGTDAGSDYIILGTTPYDRFNYEILDAPDPSLVGTTYSLHVPFKPILEKLEVDYYNSHNSDLAVDVGSETFNHTLGYLPSYLNRTQLISKASILLETDPLYVGQGGATNGVAIEVSEEVETELEYALNFEFKVGFKYGLFATGVMFSVGGKYGTTSAIGKSTEFGSEIGDIKDYDDYDNFRYSTGLVVYRHHYLSYREMEYIAVLPDYTSDLSTIRTDEIGGGSSYYVINYWVDLPITWGVNGEIDVQENANDMEELAEKFIIPGWNFLSILSLTAPISMRFYKGKKRIQNDAIIGDE